MNPWALGHGPESPRRPGRPRGHSGTGPSSGNSWSTLRVLGPRPESHGTAGRPWDHGPGPESSGRVGRQCGPSDPGPCRQGQLGDTDGSRAFSRDPRYSWSNTHALGSRRESPGTAFRHRWPSGTCPIPPGQRVDPAGHRSWPRVAGDSCRPWDLGSGTQSPGRVGRNHRPSDGGPSRPGQLVDPAGPRTKARVAEESW